MAFGLLSPVAIQQFFDANGNPLAGGTLGLFLAGTNTPSPAYADQGLTTPLANPVVLDAAGRAPELYLAAFSYKQVLKNSGGTTIWTADNVTSPTGLRATTLQTSLTGLQNDLLIPAGVITFVTFANATPVTVTGFAGGTPGQILIVRAGVNAPVYLTHQDTQSAPVNTLYNFAKSGPTPLVGPQGVAIYIYNGDPAYPFWILLTHEQGAWLQVPYNSANFESFAGDGTPSGQWQVQSSEIEAQHYMLSGTNLLVTLTIKGSNVVLAVPILGAKGWPFTARRTVNSMPCNVTDAGTPSPGLCGININEKSVHIVRQSLANWTPTASHNTAVYVQFNLDVN